MLIGDPHTVAPTHSIDLAKKSPLLGRDLLAREPVTLDDVPPTERHRVSRQSVVLGQRDDFRNTQMKPPQDIPSIE